MKKSPITVKHKKIGLSRASRGAAMKNAGTLLKSKRTAAPKPTDGRAKTHYIYMFGKGKAEGRADKNERGQDEGRFQCFHPNKSVGDIGGHLDRVEKSEK